MLAESPVLSIMLFESRIIPFKGISSLRYMRVIKVVKHIGYCFYQHASGPFDVAEDFALFRLSRYSSSEPVFPKFDHCDELLFLFVVVNIGALHENLS